MAAPCSRASRKRCVFAPEACLICLLQTLRIAAFACRRPCTASQSALQLVHPAQAALMRPRTTAASAVTCTLSGF